jgi:thiol:disulfide interchange protein DsbD
MKKTLLLFLLATLGGITAATAQVLDPVHWSFSVKRARADTFSLHLTARIDAGWHVYSQQAGDGPIPTSFTFEDNPAVTLVGDTREIGSEQKTFDKVFNSTLRYYEGQVDFVQQVTVKGSATLKGSLEYMVCNDVSCLPPKDVPFSFQLTGSAAADSAVAAPAGSVSRETSGGGGTVVQGSEDNASGRSLGWIFWACFAGGFLALITPCVFSMIPITVSFFTKRSATRALGIRNAVLYSVSIIVIYTLLGFLITVVFGASALNQLASNIWANLAFFIIFLLFGLSFLGAFEINLPSSWATGTDTKAGMTSVLGIFFMALTLTIVSFSCTGPIIGNLLVLAAQGGRTGPLVGMFGFSLALAIPFALFAIFPGWLQRIGKAGGWLNAVKVVLGLLELALALKFLSNVDMAYHWGILSKEVFLSIWIVIFCVIGIYLLGKIRFAHDSTVETISVTRLVFAIAAFAFMVYLIPGLFGRDIKGLVGGFLPTYSSFAREDSPGAAGRPSPYQNITPEKYVDIFSRSTPAGYTAFYDYPEAMAAARKLHRPLMIDFTGWSCVNCRKMESEVWTDPAVRAEINGDFVLLQLYVDDKTPLPESLQYTSKFDGSRIKRLGDKNADFEIVHFNRNSQPYYVFLDPEGQMLTSKGYSAQDGYDPSRFLSFLKKARAEYDKRSR